MLPTTLVVAFLISTHWRGFLFWGDIMQMTLIKNTDTSASLAYKIARVVYAQTGATSLHLVEAMTSMIHNISNVSGMGYLEIVQNSKIFDVLSDASPNHNRLQSPASGRGFQMCVRTAQRMLAGNLPDVCFGATRFHNDDVIPEWATARGYIADIDGVLFYR